MRCRRCIARMRLHRAHMSLETPAWGSACICAPWTIVRRMWPGTGPSWTSATTCTTAQGRGPSTSAPPAPLQVSTCPAVVCCDVQHSLCPCCRALGAPCTRIEQSGTGKHGQAGPCEWSTGCGKKASHAGPPGSAPGTPVGPYTPQAPRGPRGPLAAGAPSNLHPGPSGSHAAATRKSQELGPPLADTGMHIAARAMRPHCPLQLMRRVLQLLLPCSCTWPVDAC